MAKKNKEEGFINWHPDFRNAEMLPDVKPVRTGFLVNFAAAAILLALLGWLVVGELNISSLRDANANLEQRITAGEAGNAQLVAKGNQFKDLSGKLTDIQTFFGNDESLIALAMKFLENKPDDVGLNLFEIAARTTPGKDAKPIYDVRIEGRMMGSDTTALDRLDKFYASIQNFDTVKSRLIDITFSTPKPNEALGTTEFAVTIKMNRSETEGK